MSFHLYIILLRYFIFSCLVLVSSAVVVYQVVTDEEAVEADVVESSNWSPTVQTSAPLCWLRCVMHPLVLESFQSLVWLEVVWLVASALPYPLLYVMPPLVLENLRMLLVWVFSLALV
jgi:hypothetical protein